MKCLPKHCSPSPVAGTTMLAKMYYFTKIAFLLHYMTPFFLFPFSQPAFSIRDFVHFSMCRCLCTASSSSHETTRLQRPIYMCDILVEHRCLFLCVVCTFSFALLLFFFVFLHLVRVSSLQSRHCRLLNL